MSFFSLAGSLVRRLRYGAGIDPVRDWIILLTLSLIALASIVAWNVWAFDTAVRGGVMGPSATSTPLVFNRASLDAVRSIFESRAAEEMKYKTGIYAFSDPSQ